MLSPSPREAAASSRIVADQGDLVTVAIPARNEQQFIGRCLDSLLSQTYRNLEIIVVDSASTDRTRDVALEYAAEDARIIVLAEARASIPAALNAALKAARGRWFVRVDAHSLVPDNYVETLVGHLRSGRWGGVGGRKDGVGATPAGRAIAAAMGSRFGVGNSWYHHATSTRSVEHIPFGAYPTSLLRSVDGWDETIPANEDFELDYRLRKRGHVLLLDPGVVIRWQSRQSIGDLFAQYRRYGGGKALVAIRHPSSLLPRHMAPPLLVCTAALSLLVAARDLPVGALMLSPYVLSVLIASVLVARKIPTWSSRALVPAVFVVMHCGWGIGFIEGVVRRLLTRVRRRVGNPRLSARGATEGTRGRASREGIAETS